MKSQRRWTHAVAMAIALMVWLVMASANQSQAAWYDGYNFAAKGTLAFWPMDGNALDSSGHSLTGIVTDATLEAGRFGQCFKFNGTSSRIRVLDIQHPAALSISAWVRLDARPAPGKLATIYNRRAIYNDLIFAVNPTGKLVCSVLRGVMDIPTLVQSEISITTGSWHHLGATVDGASIRLYLDGSLVRQSPASGPLNWSGTYVSSYLGACGSADAATQFLKGRLDEVAIFNRVLSASEMLALATDTNANGQANFWEETPRIAIVAPLAGTVQQSGAAGDIIWESKNAGASVKIERSLNGGTSWVVVSAAAPTVDGRNTYHWTVPGDASSTAYVRITSNANTAVTAQQGPFTIAAAVVRSIVIAQPLAGASLTARTAYDILWDSKEAGASVKIEFSSNAGMLWTTLAAAAANMAGRNTYHWTVPNVNTNGALVRVTSNAFPTVLNQKGAFTISGATVSRTIKIVQPTAGATLTHGAAYDIIWESAEAGPYIKIERSLNGGSTWVLVAGQVANIGGRNTYHWTAPNDLSTNALVRVTSLAYPNVFATAGFFTID